MSSDPLDVAARQRGHLPVERGEVEAPRPRRMPVERRCGRRASRRRARGRGSGSPSRARCSSTSRPGTTASVDRVLGDDRRRRRAAPRTGRPCRRRRRPTSTVPPVAAGERRARPRAARAGRCRTRRRRRPARPARRRRSTSAQRGAAVGAAHRRCRRPRRPTASAPGTGGRSAGQRRRPRCRPWPRPARRRSRSPGATPPTITLAAAQHGEPVGDRPGLAQLVGDDHDRRGPSARRLVDGREEGVDLLRGEHAGGLVEDHDPAPGHEHPEDLDPLALATATGRGPGAAGRRAGRSARRPRRTRCVGRGAVEAAARRRPARRSPTTVRAGTRRRSWKTMPMPSGPGEPTARSSSTGSPSTRISPACGRLTP